MLLDRDKQPRDFAKTEQPILHSRDGEEKDCVLAFKG